MKANIQLSLRDLITIGLKCDDADTMKSIIEGVQADAQRQAFYRLRSYMAQHPNIDEETLEALALGRDIPEPTTGTLAPAPGPVTLRSGGTSVSHDGTITVEVSVTEAGIIEAFRNMVDNGESFREIADPNGTTAIRLVNPLAVTRTDEGKMREALMFLRQYEAYPDTFLVSLDLQFGDFYIIAKNNVEIDITSLRKRPIAFEAHLKPHGIEYIKGHYISEIIDEITHDRKEGRLPSKAM